jgi:archaellum component FlaG (FlaF/FlaG flagellin family)
MICIFESSTCFEQPCAHPQEDSCINTTSGTITVLVAGRYAGQDGTYGTYHRRNCASILLPTRILRNPVVIGNEEVAVEMQMATDGSIQVSPDTAHRQAPK